MPYLQDVEVEVTVECTFTGKGHWEDYGVPGSPRWFEIEPDGLGGHVTIAGERFQLRDLPKKLQDVLHDAAVDQIKDDEWGTQDE